MAKMKLYERIIVFLTSIIAAGVLVTLTPGLPDEWIMLIFGFYALLSGDVRL
jgi:hydrogenase/urease accessory protein HupE